MVSRSGRVIDYTRLPIETVSKPKSKNYFLKDIFPGGVVNLILEKIGSVHQSKRAESISACFNDRGILKTFLIRFAPYQAGKVLLLVRDISKQKQFEDHLRQSETRFRILLESAAQGIILVDMFGRISLVNTQIEKLFGYSREELVGQTIEMLLPAMYREKHVRERNQYILHTETRKMAAEQNIVGLRKDGSEFPIEISLSAVEMVDGVYVLAFTTDISERRKLENKIRRFEKLEAVGQLAGGIAHDFNNVLAGISGLTELALRKLPQDSPARKNLNLVLQKSQDAAGLVAQLLAFSRQQILSPKKLHLNFIIKNSRQMLQHYLGEDIHLQTQLAENLYSIFADQSAIDQIITNLCINARDAMPDGGDLILKTENVDILNENISVQNLSGQRAYVKLSIIDSGIGMRQEVQNHIFEPFYTTKDFGEGTGLGLATVYGLVQQHHGFLQFSSAPGEGTVFNIYLPALLGSPSLDTQTDSEQPVIGGKETILVVDDEADILKSVKGILEEYGYRVFIAANGQIALEIFEKHKDNIDLILSDVVMPKVGGMELKLMLKKLNPRCKFMFMSAYSEKIPQEMIDLHKPFLSKELLRKIRQVLDRKET